MNDIEIKGNQEKGQEFVKSIEKKKFLFSLVISYTETSEIPGITVAGSNPDFIKYTSPADSEYLHYGSCKCIDSVPMTPDGKPTPAILTKVALESASIPHVVINAGSKILPDIPFFETGLDHGKNIQNEPALDRFYVLRAVEYGRIIGRTLGAVTDCLVIGESIPAGTTTAMAVLKGFDIDAKVSSSIPENPLELKNKVVNDALKRSKSKDAYDVIANLGDPMIPLVAGMVGTASQTCKVLLAGGTQMAAVLALGHTTGYDENNIAIGTTSYIVNDDSANFLDMIKEIKDIPILVINPKLEDSVIQGLKSYSEGFVKEGVGAGGAMISAILKTGLTSEKLLQKTEEEYQRITTLQ
ncbi:MAG: nicotinate mononucleotide-dependent phosphoribosyltransferase CobT [Nitrosopumilaceae archaeon]